MARYSKLIAYIVFVAVIVGPDLARGGIPWQMLPAILGGYSVWRVPNIGQKTPGNKPETPTRTPF